MKGRITRTIVATLCVLVGWAGSAEALDLRGSRASMRKQNGIAKANGYTFVESPFEVKERVKAGELVRVKPDADLTLHRVSYPYARPEVKLFLDRLSEQYRRATGDPLVVTSLVRPTSRQPGNASPLSVHPAGMAVDLRVPAADNARRWLESTLLSLERRGVLDVTREYRPPHYHVAVYPNEYAAYVDALEARRAEAEARAREAGEDAGPAVTAKATGTEAGGDGDVASPPPADADAPDRERSRRRPGLAAALALVFLAAARGTGRRGRRLGRPGAILSRIMR